MGKNRKSRQSSARSPLNGHFREGKQLHPPFRRVRDITLLSWVRSRLPDQLWTCLLVAQLDREDVLDLFREAAASIQGAFKLGVDLDVTHTGLAAMPRALAERVVAIVCHDPVVKEALAPLLLFDDLPGLELWQQHLGRVVSLDAWHPLAETVSRVLNHQSQEATDARWARVLVRVATGQLKVPPDMLRMILSYSDESPTSSLAALVRNAEMGEHPHHDYSLRDQWAETFWSHCRRRTACDNFLVHSVKAPRAMTTRGLLRAAQVELSEVSKALAEPTQSGARHAAAFGLAGYALTLVEELLGLGVGQGVLGRLGLRSIFEASVTLGYLAAKDDPKLWEEFRLYGQGQAKLALLKAGEFDNPPAFVSLDLLEQIASQDKSHDYLSINLGNWTNLDLRKLSEISGMKPAYDRVYPWTSAFVHANWAAVQATVTATCGNPLHLLHSVQRPASNNLDDVVEDALQIVDAMLRTLERLFSVQLRESIISPEA
jgi:hypothetical protein